MKKVKYRIREIKNTATGEVEYCIDKRNIFGLWFPDWNFYTPYSANFDELKSKLISYTGELKERIVYPPELTNPTINN